MKIKFMNFNILDTTDSIERQNAKQEITPELSTTRSRQQVIESIEARLNEKRTFTEKLADNLVHWFGGISFVILNMAIFVIWILLNTGIIPDIEPFDPFPFILLTMIVSLEAIFLSIFVLMSQNRESRISDLREEIDLQVNMIAEQEITKIIHLIAYLMKHLNVPYEKDPELRRMMKPLDTEEIRQELERQLNLPHAKGTNGKNT